MKDAALHQDDSDLEKKRRETEALLQSMGITSEAPVGKFYVNSSWTVHTSLLRKTGAFTGLFIYPLIPVYINHYVLHTLFTFVLGVLIHPFQSRFKQWDNSDIQIYCGQMEECYLLANPVT